MSAPAPASPAEMRATLQGIANLLESFGRCLDTVVRSGPLNVQQRRHLALAGAAGKGLRDLVDAALAEGKD